MGSRKTEYSTQNLYTRHALKPRMSGERRAQEDSGPQAATSPAWSRSEGPREASLNRQKGVEFLT